jgi:hypothetical protein
VANVDVVLQAEDAKLKDFRGDYNYFLEQVCPQVGNRKAGAAICLSEQKTNRGGVWLGQNEDEATKMAAKEQRAREIEKSTIKAKSKMTKVRSRPCCWGGGGLILLPEQARD